MEERISISLKLDQATLTKGVKAVLDNANAVKMIKYFGIALVVASLVLFVAILKLESYAPLQGVFVGLVFIFFSSIMTYFNVKKISNDERIYEQITYKFGLPDVFIQAETFEGYLDWAQILQVVETKEFFLLYQSTLGASIIPKTAFTEEQAADFRDLITTIPDLKHNILD